MYKAVVLVFAQALIQTISAQCIGYADGLGWAGAPYGAPCAEGWGTPIGAYFDSAWNVPFASGYGPAALAASNGAGLAVTSASPIAPTGVSMTSENAYEGALAVTGAIPFLGAVAFDGALPTVGAGGVAYGCGNGNVAMLSEDIAPAFGYDGLAGPLGYGGPLGYDGFAGPLGYGGPLGYDGFAGPLGYGGPLGYDGFAGPYGVAGPLAYDGLAGPYGGYGPYGACAGPLY